MTVCGSATRGRRRPAASRVLLTTGLLGLYLARGVHPASAGVGLGMAPNYPTTVVVGTNAIPVSLSIQNTSSAPQESGEVTLSNIKHTPSCGDTSASVCVGPAVDPGVFTVAPTGKGGGNAACTAADTPYACCSGAGKGNCNACKDITFTIAVAEPATGEVLFTPSTTVNLGQPGSATDTCIIDFTINVNKLPKVDAGPAPG